MECLSRFLLTLVLKPFKFADNERITVRAGTSNKSLILSIFGKEN